MARPRLGEEPYEKLTVRVDKGTMGEILAYMEHLKAASLGLRVDLGGTARRLLLYGLTYAKALQRQEAARQDQTVDHAPVLPDQSAPPIAKRQDRKRTTRSTRTAAQG